MKRLGKFLVVAFLLLKPLVLLAQVELIWDDGTNHYRNTSTLKEWTTRQRQSQLNIFWWNVGNEYLLNAEKGLNENRPLWKNIIQLSKQNDTLFLLGEVRFSEVPKKVWESLQQNYITYKVPYSHRLPDFGNLVIINRNLKVKITSEHLDWVPNEWSENRKNSYKKTWLKTYPKNSSEIIDFERDLPVISILWKKKQIRLSVADLLMPWEMMEKTIGKIKTARQIARKTDDPLGFQIEHFNKNVKEQTWIALGDFNFSKGLPYLGNNLIKGAHYRKMIQFGFMDTMPVDQISFPSTQAKEWLYSDTPRVRIDHIFIKGQTIPGQFTAVLPLKGSDHLPLWVAIP